MKHTKDEAEIAPQVLNDDADTAYIRKLNGRLVVLNGTFDHNNGEQTVNMFGELPRDIFAIRDQTGPTFCAHWIA